MSRIPVMIAVGAVALAACGSSDAEVASSTTMLVADAEASPAETTASTNEPSPTQPPATSPPPATSEPEPPPATSPATSSPEPLGGDFCDELRAFLAEWVNDEIGPADLTARYASLGAIAPDELVEPFRILEEGNAILVDTLDSGQLPDPAGYEAAGNQLGAYASEVCGLAFEEL